MHLELDREGERAGVGPATCAMVAVLDGRADIEALRRRVSDATRQIPELEWRLGRDRWWQPRWQPGAPPAEVALVESDADWVETTEMRIANGLGPRCPWRLELWRGPEQDAVALRWLHAFDDAYGAARLVELLAGEGDAANTPVGERFAAPESRLASLDWRQRLALTRAYGDHALAIAQAGPIVSPRRAAGDGPPGRRRLRRLTFTAAETSAFIASLRERARLADTSLLLFAAARLYRRVLRARGETITRCVVPVPLSLDPKRGCRRLFGNHVTIMLLTLDGEALEDEQAAVASLAAQQRSIVRDKLDRAMIASLDTLRVLPDAASQWLAKSPFGGQRCSFVLSNPGPLSFDRLAGRSVVDAFTTPIAGVDPGLLVVGQRFDARMSVILSFWDGYISEADLRAQEPAFRRDMLGSCS